MEFAKIDQPETTARLSRSPRILIVEDDVSMQPLWSYVVETASPGAQIKWVLSEEAADQAIRTLLQKSDAFDLIISDIFLAGSRTGLDLWKKHAEGPSPFLMTSMISSQKLNRLLGEDSPPPFFMPKPLNPKSCVKAVRTMLLFRELIL